jgi:hypothetical protein
VPQIRLQTAPSDVVWELPGAGQRQPVAPVKRGSVSLPNQSPHVLRPAHTLVGVTPSMMYVLVGGKGFDPLWFCASAKEDSTDGNRSSVLQLGRMVG